VFAHCGFRRKKQRARPIVHPGSVSGGHGAVGPDNRFEGRQRLKKREARLPRPAWRLGADYKIFTQSTGMRVATQMPAPSNEYPPPMLTVRFDCGTLAPGPKVPGRAHCGVPFNGAGGTTKLI
jgi:hypothetical protein